MIGRIPILDVDPVLDCGRRPAKAVTGETFEVTATVFREGHEMLGAGVVLRGPGGERSALARMRELAPGTDRYGAEVTVGAEGLWQFQVEAWGDPIAHWRHDAGIKVPRGLETELMLTEGALLLERAAHGIRPARLPCPPGIPAGGRWASSAVAAQEARAARAALRELAALLRDPAVPPWDRLAAASSGPVLAVLAAYPLRDMITRSARYPVIVHRQRALYGAWYEFFPRSEGVDVDPMGYREPRSGTLRNAEGRLDDIADMGFDVVYLPPVHPIGTTARKGAEQRAAGRAGRPGLAVGDRLPRGRARRAAPRSGHVRRTSTTSWPGPRSWAWRSHSTWPCRPRPITRG